jgi:[acyl-carrier-protein] S-malonyltransferase
MKVAILFPGQGSQYPGMADAWSDHPAGKETLEQASEILGWDVVQRSREPAELERTEVVQPAVFACDLAAFAVLCAEGIRFEIAAGHSLGEYAALVASGALGLRDGLTALTARADAMGRAARETPGAMTALIGIGVEDAREVCEIAGRGDVLAVANENAPKQTVLAGTLTAVERAEQLARGRGARAIRLNVAGAFHSPLMAPALAEVRRALSRVAFSPPALTIVPNVSARPTREPVELRDLLSRHLVSPVRWDATMRAIAHLGADAFVEAGPGDVLSKLARRAVPHAAVEQAGSPAAAFEALGRLGLVRS